jgi:hypothetical protein
MEGVRLRRISLKAHDSAGKKQVFTIAPSGVMPYFAGYTDEVEKAVFLRRFDVPFWVLAYMFGHDDQYWYRQEPLRALGQRSNSCENPAEITAACIGR